MLLSWHLPIVIFILICAIPCVRPFHISDPANSGHTPFLDKTYVTWSMKTLPV